MSEDGQQEVGIRKSEVGTEEESQPVEGASVSEGGQSREDGQVREEKLGAKKESIRERRRRYLGLDAFDSRYDFSAIPELQSALAKMAK